MRVGPLVMGVVNATPDSFSDGGRHEALEDAVAQARALLEAGADLIDIGGESTRPGATPVSEEDELARVLPLVEALAGSTVPVSVDTRKPGVMRAASTARSRPIMPDHRVIGNTAARVMTSHLPTVSSGSVAGGLAVCMISAHARNRSRRVIGVAGVSWAGVAVVMSGRLAGNRQ